MYTYDVSRMPRCTLFSSYHSITSTCQSLYSQYAQAFYTSWLATGFLQKKSPDPSIRQVAFIHFHEPRCSAFFDTLNYHYDLLLSYIYIAHPRSTNRVTILRHTSTNRVTILRPAHNNNNNLPSASYFHTNLFCLK